MSRDKNVTETNWRASLKLAHTALAAFNDYMEGLRGRLAAGPMREALSMHPRAITLALKAEQEADANVGEIETRMMRIVRQHKAAIREATKDDSKKGAVPLYTNDDQRADALAVALEGDPDHVALARLADEQYAVKEDMRLAADELRRQEVNLRVERDREARLEVLAYESEAREAAIALERTMRREATDYQLQAVRDECAVRLETHKAMADYKGQ